MMAGAWRRAVRQGLQASYVALSRTLPSPSRRWRARRAVMVVEFALIGPPFLFLLVFMLELGYDLYAQEMLDYGMQTAARSIQIGAMQGSGSAASATFMSSYLCPAVSGFLNCNNIAINVGKVTDYYAAGGLGSEGIPTTSGKLDTSKFAFCTGSQNELMLATAVYTSPSIVSLFVPQMAISNGSSFVRATFSASAFVNEDFTTTSASGC